MSGKSNKLSIRLYPREDKNGKQYFVGRLKFPGTIELKNGATFLAFISDPGYEELQVAVSEKEEKEKF